MIEQIERNQLISYGEERSGTSGLPKSKVRGFHTQAGP